MSNGKIKAAIVGATGYGGAELIRLLHHHPYAEVCCVLSSSSGGTPLSASFPHLTNIIELELEAIEPAVLKNKADVVFLATPAGVSAELAPKLLEQGLKVIDLSGDLRLKDGAVYEKWYKRSPAANDMLERAVYGLSDVYGERVSGQPLIANPGCFPTATLLGLIPAVKEGWIDPATIIIDAKTGVSGAGRGTGLGTHYSEINESVKAYKVNAHQHIPEIEQVLTETAGREVVVTFTTHLIPMTRGILSTIYASVDDTRAAQDFIDLYRTFYADRPFVRIRENGILPATKEVSGSNYCDIGFSVDERTGRVTIVSAIDNMVKGAAGQAIQNLNLMMGWDEAEGLNFIPVYP
ncbi:N-acetyl-gamma-glutamyl-phosphate reductase [Saccharibacillus sp. CPCC 101409]|uniref:N-acetyl-gamma-glutamyl-phosphate reductase n=1 Tax=Saccharibacillus sp. CPCC 101409 TaxID=3058041 RepID=UPI002673B7D7|nr:N-acetyl-gamma-glutamyl-phosphate reductase [Saccharibacillus sp. CPCC 101409]MDO3412061.1 N-acetyl-gamma-glutamyl-phosphate reductase [Saccharibacillus sp. CPCC 101409]